MTKEELKNYRIKTIKEFIKEFSHPEDENIPEFEEWRDRVGQAFVHSMDIFAGKKVSDLNIVWIKKEPFHLISDTERLFSASIINKNSYEDIWEFSKQMLTPILSEKINKLMNL